MRGPRFNPGATLVVLAAFAILGYSAWNLYHFNGLLLSRWRDRSATAAPVPPPTSSPSTTPSTPSPTPAVEPTPSATPTAPAPRYLAVANTEGQGVFLRRTMSPSDRLRAWPDATRLEFIEGPIDGEGQQWYRVRDPAGNEGFVPAPYVEPISP